MNNRNFERGRSLRRAGRLGLGGSLPRLVFSAIDLSLVGGRKRCQSDSVQWYFRGTDTRPPRREGYRCIRLPADVCEDEDGRVR